MKPFTIRRVALFATAAIATLAIAGGSIGAQESRLAPALSTDFAQVAQTSASATVTLTEAQINSSFRVTNPRARRLSNVSVDLQPGQAVVSATYTTRVGNRGAGTQNWAVVATFTPVVQNGRITWTTGNVTVNGTAATADQVAQINQVMSDAWRSLIRTQGRSGYVTAVSITDAEFIVTFATST